MSITYNSCKPVTSKHNEHNDCTVKALAIATNSPYIKAHAVLASLGRVNRRGVNSLLWDCGTAETALKNLGFTAKTITVPAKTIASLSNYLDPSKRYICTVRGHALAYANGKVEDWSEGSKRRILKIQEVTPIQSKNAARKAARYL